ncbi:MAG TPA: DUF5985 family protein [Candidatus Binatia bacterium]|jgi:uncharacterized membrane protein HdeD (DUF308 family)
MTSALNETLIGAIAMASLVIGVFFLRFWRDGGDRFFLLFALSFFVEGVNRVAQALSASPNEGTLSRYGIRLVAFGLILAAILDKNRSKNR